ncbi:hypothetical protein ID854_02935 [Xenorhabdus sp. M]|uniref:Uncharacterized protein n=1 Tax=Xenorhabdus szentirmaii TaxID=290112 RepID=A0AAW3YNB5_9GAMM|nr:hypothetical protein [Xenorhabdus sp. M]MBD2799440.1 hypothetical protein [Xenorhabdus sp. M]
MWCNSKTLTLSSSASGNNLNPRVREVRRVPAFQVDVHGLGKALAAH